MIFYIYYQVQSLDQTFPTVDIVKQTAYPQTAYTVAQCISNMLWVAVSDSLRGGRKLVVLLGLSGSCESMFNVQHICRLVRESPAR